MNASVGFLSRDEWLSQVGELTREHRESRADAYERRADDVRREVLELARARHEYAVASGAFDALADADLDVVMARAGDEAQDRTAWHRQRAAGQRRRVESVRSCAQDGVMQVGCTGCGEQRHYMRTCSSSLLCSQCRTRRNHQTRQRFRRSRLVAIAALRRRGLLHGYGRWSEKLLTLTVPHSELGRPLDPERRLALLKKGWVRLLRDLNRLVFGPASAAKRVEVHWYAAHEWTPGADGLGHPHMHVWLLCPWLEREFLVERWRVALAAEGFRWGDDEVPILDVRAARGRDGRTDDSVADELIKYLTKDLVETKSEHGANRLVDPAVYARMYRLYDGKRRSQGSKGFTALADENVAKATCCSCGACGFEVTFVRSDEPHYQSAIDGVAFTRSASEQRRGRDQIPIAAA